MSTETEPDAEPLPNRTEADARRVDVDRKQELVGRWLNDIGCEGLLVLHPPNFRWLTSGANPVGLFGRDEVPALYFNTHQRWLISAATDSPRLFAEDLDGLGFMLKEWHWTTSREQLLVDLVFGRKVACDQMFRECQYAGTFFASTRRRHTAYEASRLAELGELVTHAIEATARHFNWGDPEDEIAGHLAHRLFRHGVEPVAIQIIGDGRGRTFRRCSHRNDLVHRWCCLQATGRKFGLHVTTSRTVFRVPPNPEEREEFEFSLRLRVAHLATARVGEPVSVSLDTGKALLRPTPFEHEWRIAPPVCLTGREPSEGVFLPAAQDRWTAGWAAVWQERIGEAAVVDTFLLTGDGWKPLTAPDDWPVRRAVSQGRSFDLADLLVRGD